MPGRARLLQHARPTRGGSASRFRLRPSTREPWRDRRGIRVRPARTRARRGRADAPTLPPVPTAAPQRVEHAHRSCPAAAPRGRARGRARIRAAQPGCARHLAIPRARAGQGRTAACRSARCPRRTRDCTEPATRLTASTSNGSTMPSSSGNPRYSASSNAAHDASRRAIHGPTSARGSTAVGAAAKLPAVELAHLEQVRAHRHVPRMAGVGDVAIGLHRCDQAIEARVEATALRDARGSRDVRVSERHFVRRQAGSPRLADHSSPARPGSFARACSKQSLGLGLVRGEDDLDRALGGKVKTRTKRLRLDRCLAECPLVRHFLETARWKHAIDEIGHGFLRWQFRSSAPARPPEGRCAPPRGQRTQ